MDTESSSNSVSDNVGDEQNRDSSKPVLPKRDSAAHNKSHKRQVDNARKMSVMAEEEDVVSDDTDPDVIRISHHQYHYEKRGETEPEWSTEEGGRLLSPSGRRIVVAPTAPTSNNVRRTTGRDDSPDSGQDRCPPRWQQSRLIDQSESRSSPSRDNGAQSPGRLLRSVNQVLVRHHHRCPCVRSLRPPIVMDECQQHCSCCHQPPSWASILYADVNGQARSCPDTVSIRSLASIGLGSSDGRKLTIRRVPTSPSELLNMVHPPP